MTGIFVIALPIPIIVGNFTECYKEKKLRHRKFRRKSLIQSRNNIQRIVSRNNLKGDLSA